MKYSGGSRVVTLILLCLCAPAAHSQSTPGRFMPEQVTQMASLRPANELLWQRVSPSVHQPDGPVLYQLVLSAGTAGTLAKFDSNPRHLTNSDITDIGGVVSIGGLTIDSSTGIISFANGQTFPAASLPPGGGDVSGTYPNLTVTGLEGRAISNLAPTAGQVLQFNGTQWGPATPAAAPAAWLLGGNAGTGCTTSPCASFLGTADNSALEIRVMGNRALRIEPAVDGQSNLGFSPNMIGGFSGNAVTGQGTAGATIGGGGGLSAQGDLYNNLVSASFGTIGGGLINTAGGIGSTVGGGSINTASGNISTVAGGHVNTASASHSTVGGGFQNTASGSASTIAGGSLNVASGDDSTVAGGASNTASGELSAVAGGIGNAASGKQAAVVGGNSNTASGDFSFVAEGVGNASSGIYSFVAGGYHNTASGDHSFAAGYLANTNNHKGTFVWGDGLGSGTTATADYQFVAQASGGVIFYTNPGSTGVEVPAGGGSWSSLSDRNVKANFRAINGLDILAELVKMPVTMWNYKSQSAAIRHIGPMAQDFFAAFKVGEDDRHITEIDEGGVALAAIQGLNQKLEQDEQKLKQKDEEVRLLKSRLEKLEAEVTAILHSKP